MVLAGSVLAMAGATTATASESLPTTPSIQVVEDSAADHAVTSPSPTFELKGAKWPANTLIQLDVCGDEARSGSSECSTETSQIVASDAFGSFRARMSVIVPPSGCPCVVRAVSEAKGVVVIAPVEIPGAPTALVAGGDVAGPTVRRLEVQSVALLGSDSWGAWIGGHPRRGLEFTVVNTGDVALVDCTVSVAVGPSGDATRSVPAVSLGRLDVNVKKTYRVPVEFDAISFGQLVVTGEITGTGEHTTFTATTSSYPWFLVAVPIVLILVPLSMIARILARRRLRGDESPVSAEDTADPIHPNSVSVGIPIPPGALSDDSASGTRVEASEGNARRILSIGDFLDELLAWRGS